MTITTTPTRSYDYATCLRGSVDRAWTVDECFDGRDFDFTRSFLPDRIAGSAALADVLDADERRLLNQIRGSSYCHIFGFVEAYIVPLVMDHARSGVHDDSTRLWALLRFAEEEVKHQQMMERAAAQFDAGFPVPCGRVDGQAEVAGAVLAAPPLTALLLTAMIEWFTQQHYVEHVRDAQQLDPLFRDLLRYHWIDESRHARLDTLLIDEVAAGASADEREQAVDHLLALGGAVDGLLDAQRALDLDALQRATDRAFTTTEQDRIATEQQRSYRWTFLVSGMQHPRFVETLEQLSPAGAAKVAATAVALS